MRPWDGDSLSSGQEIPFLLWKPEVRYCVHNSPPLDPMLRQLSPVHILTFYSFLKSVLILSSSMTMPSKLSHSDLSTKILYAFMIPLRATCSAHLILLDLITLIIIGEGHKLWSTLLSNFHRIRIYHFYLKYFSNVVYIIRKTRKIICTYSIHGVVLS